MSSIELIQQYTVVSTLVNNKQRANSFPVKFPKYMTDI